MKALICSLLLSAMLVDIGHAQDACSSSPCDTNACCTSVEDTPVCTCFPGFEGDGFNCTDIDECDVCENNDCSSNATCYNAIGSYVCRCKDGFSGDGFDCEDINECDAEDACKENSVCENTDGGYTCPCDEGYTGDGTCGCSRINPCTDELAAVLCDGKFDICVQDEDDEAGFRCDPCEPPEKPDDLHLQCEHPGKGGKSSNGST